MKRLSSVHAKARRRRISTFRGRRNVCQLLYAFVLTAAEDVGVKDCATFVIAERVASLVDTPRHELQEGVPWQSLQIS